MTAPRGGPAQPLRRLSRPAVVAGAVTVVGLLLVGSFVAGRFFAEPAWRAAQDGQSVIAVWSPVERRVVDDRASWAGVVREPPETAIAVDGGGVGRSVVVRQSLEPGEVADCGTLAGVVSGAPYFLLPGPLPLYRDLRAGDSGDDVAHLQRALTACGFSVRETGTVDTATMRAVRRMFDRAGFALPAHDQMSPDGAEPAPRADGTQPTTPMPAPPPVEVLPHLQLLALPGGAATVVASAQVSTVLGPEVPLLTVRTGQPTVEFTADVVDAESIGIGTQLAVRTAVGEQVGMVTDVGPFREATAESTAGRAVVVNVERPEELGRGATVTVAAAGGEDAPELSVPMTALRQDGAGSYVQLRDNTTETGTRRVAVEIVRTGGGYAAVRGKVSEGDEVQVSRG